MIEPAADRRFGGLCGTPRFGLLGHRKHHAAEFFQAIGRISAGIAKSLTGYQQIAIICEFTTILGQKTAVNRRGQTLVGPHRPTKCCLGIYFVDVLSTRSAAAGKGKSKFPQGNLKPGSNDQHQGRFHLATRIDFLPYMSYCNVLLAQTRPLTTEIGIGNAYDLCSIGRHGRDR